MDATITRAEREPGPGIWAEPAQPDYRARHIANARQWRRQYLDCLEGKLAPGAEAHAIWEAFLGECRKANVEPDMILPAVHSLN